MLSVSRLGCVAAVVAAGWLAGAGGAGEAAKLAPDPSLGRNPVNLTAKNLPAEWSVEEGKFKNVKWSQDTGSRGYGENKKGERPQSPG